MQLGLTATPKRRDNVDTYAYFGEPVYTYSLKDGINDGFLTPFKVKQIATTLDDYVYTPDDKVVEGEVEEGKRYREPQFNRTIEIEERERYRVKLFMEQIDQREKTLVFCATQGHAALVRDLINQMKTSSDPNYCVRVTADDGELGEQWLRTFQDNEKTIPTILTTSQKLSTGVDARNVRNIVLMRPIGTMIEFKQIIGRGTRLFDGKDYFTIYDFVKAYEHFNDPEWDGEPMEPVVAKPTAPRGKPEVRGRRRRRTTSRPPERPKTDQDQACRRQGAHHPAHDGDELLEPGRQADLGQPDDREAVRRAAALLQGRGRTAAALEPARTRARRCCRAWPRRALAREQLGRNQPDDQRREERCFRRAGLHRLCAGADHAIRAGRDAARREIFCALRSEAAGVPGFRAGAICEAGRRGA